MKKITLSLFAAALSCTSVFAQLIINAPPLNVAGNTTPNRAPNGNALHTTMRAMYNIPASELTGLNTSIVSFGFEIESGLATAAGGTLIVYMQNSPNSTYTMGTTWSTSGMTQVYSGAYNIPVSVNPVSVDLTLPLSFPYTQGSALNIAYEYVGATFDPQFAAFYLAYNNPGVAMGATNASSTTTSPSTLALTDFRPVYRLGTTAFTNDVEVVRIISPGKYPKIASPQVIQAEVKNNSNTLLSNIGVGLAVTGANIFPNSQIIPSLAAGATTIVNFAPFTSTVQGINTISVGVLADQNNFNNAKSWTQSVTCNILSNNPPATAFSIGLGFVNPRMFLKQVTSPTTSSIKALRIAIGTETNNIGAPIYGALVNGSGSIIATTNTIVISNTVTGTVRQFDFATPVNVVAGTNYYLGCAQTTPSTFPIGTATTVADQAGLFSVPSAGSTSITPLVGAFVYLGLEAVYSSTLPAISSQSTKSVICVGQTATITASGATSYTWTSPTSTNVVTTASISVSPTVNTVYTISAIDAGGCSNKASFTQSVSACLGIALNTASGSEITVYPNPAVNGKTSITGLNGDNTIVVYNILGQTILTQNTKEEIVNIDLAGQPNGTYLVKIIDATNKSKVAKVVVQN